MSAAVASESKSDEVALLRELYGANKSLSLSISAALALRLSPEVSAAQIDGHLADCERAAAEHHGDLGPHFEACRAAAADLAALARKVDGEPGPSQRRLRAVRRSHRHLRRLVWEVFDCEYVPCGHERNR